MPAAAPLAGTRAKLIESREIAPEVRHLIFEVPAVERVDFVPGQFVSLTEEIGGKAITRAYSTAAPPRGNRFELCLNRVQDGKFSPFLFALKPGDEVPVKGIYGVFTLRDPVRDAVMIATGTGIAPFRAMLLDYYASAPGPGSRKMTLLFGVRHEYGILYRGEFEELARRAPQQFAFWPTLSRPAPGWAGRSGRVQAHLEEAVAGRTDIDVYVCGLKEMVEDVRSRLKEMGFDRRQIIAEKYD
jgi:CDP-4-dehydro-6-deoxyglucose reductase